MSINNRKRLDFKSGFTLIELIVIIAIMGIVIAMAYSIGDFGNRSFNNGSVKSDIQSDTRLAANYITKELRYSSNAEILPSFPITPVTSKKYIYVENGILKQYYNGIITKIIGDTSKNIIATFQIQNSKTVNFNIQETFKNQTFKLNSTILLLNIGVNTLATQNQALPVISYWNEPAITPTLSYSDLDTMFSNTITAIDKSSSSTGCVFTTGIITGKMHVSTSKAVKFSGGMPINGDLSIDSDQSIDINTNGGNLGNNIILNSKGPVSMNSSQFPFGNISITADSYSTNNAAITCKDFHVATTNDTVINSPITCTNFVVANSINTKIIAIINCADLEVNASTGISIGGINQYGNDVGGSINSSGNILLKAPAIILGSALTYINMSLISNSITKNTYNAVNSIKGFPAYAASQISYLYQWITKINCVGPPSYSPVLPNNNVYNATFDSNTPQIWPTVSTADYSKLDGTTNEFFYNGPKTLGSSPFNDYTNLIIVCKGDLTLGSDFNRTKISGQKTVIYCTGNVTAYGKLNGLIIAKNISGGGGFSITGLQQGVKENDDFLSLAKAFITKSTQSVQQ